ncbi:MAG: glycosyltransferase family 2 protein [Gemmatimonadota bacterium]|nr:glycosyltransferase family 2 protein [Gemmatimonadota bacterium]
MNPSNLPAAAPGVSAMVMAYNEVASLRQVVVEIGAALSVTGLPYEIVVIDDGSSDGTGPLADELARTIGNVRSVHHAVNGGVGQVYRTGFGEAGQSYVTFFPADGQFPATILHQFLALMPSHDMVLGYLDDRDDPLLAKTLSFARGVVHRILLGSSPRFQGVTMFRRELPGLVGLRCGGRTNTVINELIIRVHRAGYRTVSVATPMRPRAAGQSKVNNFRTIRDSLADAVALRRYM